MDYRNVAQGKTVIPGVDDGEELTLTDVIIFDSFICIDCDNFDVYLSMMHEKSLKTF